jgi:hypothetical protein
MVPVDEAERATKCTYAVWNEEATARGGYADYNKEEDTRGLQPDNFRLPEVRAKGKLAKKVRTGHLLASRQGFGYET